MTKDEDGRTAPLPPKPRQVSKAPPPVPTLSGRGGFHPPDTDFDYWAKQAGKPDWSHWSNMAIVDLVDACYLSFDVDPVKARSFHDADKKLSKVACRYQIAENNLGRGLPSHMTDSDEYYGRGGTGVNLSEFRAWGESLSSPFTFPGEFPGKPRVSDARATPSNEELARVARMDLWSGAELSGLCAGLLPDAPNRTDDELIAVNAAREAIARGTLSRTLSFVPRDDADTAARMYDTARHYVPAIAAEWAATRFDTFPASLLVAVRESARATPEPVASVPAQDKPLSSRERNNLLRIIRALDAMNPQPLPEKGYAESIRTMLRDLELTAVRDPLNNSPVRMMHSDQHTGVESNA